MRNSSLLGDLSILLMTVPAAQMRRGAGCRTVPWFSRYVESRFLWPSCVSSTPFPKSVGCPVPLDRRSHLHQLESESIFLVREVAAQFERPILLFSGGKDSILMVQLAAKAFAPTRIPFPLVHIDTGHNFPGTLDFRGSLVAKHGATLHVGLAQASIDTGRVQAEPGPNPSRNRLETVTPLDTLAELKADVALGGPRRDAEKARAKERFFSHRDRFGQWDPKNQRSELCPTFEAHFPGAPRAQR